MDRRVGTRPEEGEIAPAAGRQRARELVDAFIRAGEYLPDYRRVAARQDGRLLVGKKQHVREIRFDRQSGCGRAFAQCMAMCAAAEGYGVTGVHSIVLTGANRSTR